MTPLLVTRHEVAEALRIDGARVDRLVAEGRLTPVRLFPDDEPRFRPGDLLDLIATVAL